MTAGRRLQIAIVLALIGAALSGLLLMQHHGEHGAVSAVQRICGEGESGCDRVNQSRFSEAGGIPLAAFGLLFYLAVAILAALAPASDDDARAAAGRLIFTMAAVALVIDAALLGIQAFSIKAFCIFCLATYAINAALLWLFLPMRRAALAAKTAEGRLAVKAGLIAMLAGVAAVAAGEGWLRARAEYRAATLMGGAPASAAASTTPAATAASGDIAVLQEQVRTLQATLDDPQKRNDYVTAKELKDFETATVQMLDLNAPRKGDGRAPITVVEFADMLCPRCREAARWFKEYVPATKGRVAVLFKNFPLDKSCNGSLTQTLHPGACLLAMGGLCAEEQGKFWDYHDRVFSMKADHATMDDVRRFGRESGLDAARLDTCVASPKTRQRLEAQIAEAMRVGVNGTPALFINNKKVSNLNLFVPMVESEARRLGLPPPQ
jgi:protein-disulfide isomerase